MDSKLASVSTPGSAHYGKYLEREDLDALFAPSGDKADRVKAWLQQSGISDIESDRDTVSFKTTVSDANRLLNTKFGFYSNGEQLKLRTLAYSVPDDLSDAIDLISPTTFFGNMKARMAVPNLQPTTTKWAPLEARQLKPSCETTISIPISAHESKDFTVIGPKCLKQLYNVGDYKADPNSGSSIAFGSFLNQSASYSDLAQFEKIYDLPSQNFTVTLINGGVDNQDALTQEDGEANLDVQNIIGLVDGLPVSEYITSGSPPFVPDLLLPNASANTNEPYLQCKLPFLNASSFDLYVVTKVHADLRLSDYQYLLSQSNDDLPYVISNSYGDHENTVPERYAKRVCNMIGMMGMRGRTILESSGDEGVGAVCLSNTGDTHPEFTPQFPGTCPYVTSVGGTQFVNPEVAWNASSGGFSFYFPAPSYQKSAVQTYLNDYISSETKDYYSSNKYVDFTGRGFPDISAHSLWPDYLTVINGTAAPNGGTSAAAPVVGALIALLNDARFRAGQPAMGFLNPWLYNHAAPKKALKDVTGGGSLGCAGVNLQSGDTIPGAGKIPYASWNATTGWDPVTGLGIPDFQKMKSLATSS